MNIHLTYRVLSGSQAGGSPRRLPEGPWYRASRDGWYVRVDGKQVRLAKGKANKKATLDAFHRLMAFGPGGLPKTQEITAAHVCDLFLVWSEKHHDAKTFGWYKSFLTSFCKHERPGALPAAQLKVFHVIALGPAAGLVDFEVDDPE